MAYYTGTDYRGAQHRPEGNWVSPYVLELMNVSGATDAICSTDGFGRFPNHASSVMPNGGIVLKYKGPDDDVAGTSRKQNYVCPMVPTGKNAYTLEEMNCPTEVHPKQP